ncbi:MAG: 2-hydroxychromene-2-carboxylate isomerase [Myxococcaceae bacterium]|nr:2-hydroxychromene-2-carboxylate isomerase [Myxococcaceae bacterium]
MARTLEFFFDLMSPYSYLAATQLGGLAARTGAEVRWRPCFLPAVLKATGNRGPAEIPAKAFYLYKDLNDWAAHYGLPPVVLPSNFPFLALTADRACLFLGDQAPAFALQVMRRIWVDGADCNSPEVLEPALRAVGADPASVLERARSEDAKALLKQASEEAVSRGAFGVPTFFVDAQEMFVGNDRLQFVEAALKKLP